MSLSQEADQLLPPIMTPFTELFQQMQRDPMPLTFPVHSQTSLDVPPSLNSHSCPLLLYLDRALWKRLLHRMEFLPHNALRPDGVIEHTPALPVVRHGFAKKFAAIWSAMAKPKMQDRTRAA